MKIIVCGSMKTAVKMVEVKNALEEMGHEVALPRHTEEYANNFRSEETPYESAKNKIEGDLIRDYFGKIKEGDAVLVVNKTLKGVENYIGGNSFLEMAFGHVLDKKVYLLNPIPVMSYTDELIAMQPVILNGNLGMIK